MLFGNALGGSICGQDGGGKVFADPQFCATNVIRWLVRALEVVDNASTLD